MGVLVSVNFGCFSPSRFLHFHCNAMREAIKAHKNLHKNQQNEHTLGFGIYMDFAAWTSKAARPTLDVSIF